MFKDRRVLIEKEVVQLKQKCGQLYKRIAMGQSDLNDSKTYESMKMALADLMADLAIIDQMIEDGHE